MDKSCLSRSHSSIEEVGGQAEFASETSPMFGFGRQVDVLLPFDDLGAVDAEPVGEGGLAEAPGVPGFAEPVAEGDGLIVTPRHVTHFRGKSGEM